MRRIHIHRNRPRTDPYHKRFGVARLPVRQTLIWCGPVFISVRPQ